MIYNSTHTVPSQTHTRGRKQNINNNLNLVEKIDKPIGRGISCTFFFTLNRQCVPSAFSGAHSPDSQSPDHIQTSRLAYSWKNKVPKIYPNVRMLMRKCVCACPYLGVTIIVSLHILWFKVHIFDQKKGKLVFSSHFWTAQAADRVTLRSKLRHVGPVSIDHTWSGSAPPPALGAPPYYISVMTVEQTNQKKINQEWVQSRENKFATSK